MVPRPERETSEDQKAHFRLVQKYGSGGAFAIEGGGCCLSALIIGGLAYLCLGAGKPPNIVVPQSNLERMPVLSHLLYATQTDGLAGMIRFYQTEISPVLNEHGTPCKFTPSCSEYALKAVEKHGPLRGGILSIGRLLRCNPYSHGGIDTLM